MNYPVVNREICGYCGGCISVCPTSALDLVDVFVSKNESLCIGCRACAKVCPLGAIKMENKAEATDAVAESPLSIVSQQQYDVLVIGAGPSGSIAAKTAAENGMNVLMVEKRQEIGTPVRCAEGISSKPLARFIKPDPKWICAEIKGGRVYSPDGNFAEITEPGSGFILERKIFDRELAYQAAQAGAEVWVKSRAIDLIKENGSIKGAFIRRRDGDYKIQASVVIGADGVESKAGKWAGIDTTCKPNDLDTCVQYLMTGLGDIDQEYCHFFLGKDMAPRGYAWIFPKGNDCANVGIGIDGNIDNETAANYLNKFVKEKLPNASILGMVAGCVPIAGMLSDAVRDGFMLIGDAAHQNDPVSGGGIINGMIAGEIAGEIAAKAIRKGDVSASVLAEYDKLWHKEVGQTFKHLRRIREGVLKFSDETYNSIANILSSKEGKKVTMIDMFWTALKNDPKLLLELRHLIKLGWAQ